MICKSIRSQGAKSPPDEHQRASSCTVVAKAGETGWLRYFLDPCCMLCRLKVAESRAIGTCGELQHVPLIKIRLWLLRQEARLRV